MRSRNRGGRRTYADEEDDDDYEIEDDEDDPDSSDSAHESSSSRRQVSSARLDLLRSCWSRYKVANACKHPAGLEVESPGLHWHIASIYHLSGSAATVLRCSIEDILS